MCIFFYLLYLFLFISKTHELRYLLPVSLFVTVYKRLNEILTDFGSLFYGNLSMDKVIVSVFNVTKDTCAKGLEGLFYNWRCAKIA